MSTYEEDDPVLIIGDRITEVRDRFERSPRDADSLDVAEEVIEALVTKAFRDQAEGALRWLDPSGDIQDRLGLDPVENARRASS